MTLNEILAELDPMYWYAVARRVYLLHMIEQHRGGNPLGWDRCGVARTWPARAGN